MQKAKWLAVGVALTTLGLSSVRADEHNIDKPFSVGVDVGTLGPGLTASYRFSDLLGVRAGVNYLPYSKDNNEVEGINYNTKLRLLSAPVGIDIYPWRNPFRLTLGILFNENRFTADAPQQAPGALSIPLGNSGGIDSAAIGDLHMKVDQNVISPYLAIGGNWFLDDAKRWSLGGEIGVAYAGKPDVTLTRSNGPDAIDAQLAIEQQQLKDALKKYTLYPIIKVSLSFSF